MQHHKQFNNQHFTVCPFSEICTKVMFFPTGWFFLTFLANLDSAI